MNGTKISVHIINNGLVGLAEISASNQAEAAVLSVPGGGRVLIDAPDVVARVMELFGPSASATNPYEQRRRKEFLRRASRAVGRTFNGV